MTEHLYAERHRESEAAPIRAEVGMHVEMELLTATGESEAMVVDIVPDKDADFASGFLGAGTPLAQAIAGQTAGSLVPYRMADVVEVRILAVTPSRETPSEDAASNRQAVIDEAVSKSNLADTLRLALSVDVKWGDYDPEALEKNWDK